MQCNAMQCNVRRSRIQPGGDFFFFFFRVKIDGASVAKN